MQPLEAHLVFVSQQNLITAAMKPLMFADTTASGSVKHLAYSNTNHKKRRKCKDSNYKISNQPLHIHIFSLFNLTTQA